MSLRILIVEPEQSLRESLELLLSSEEHEVACAADAGGAISQLESGPYDVILCDLLVPAEAGGSTLVRWLVRRVPGTTVIATSESSADDSAQTARREGAYDHVIKPFRTPQTLLAVDRAAERQRMQSVRDLLQRELRLVVGDRPIVAASAAMIELLELIERTASFQVPVLLVGEPGTGKEGLARAIHAQSPRRHRPFVPVTCRSSAGQELEQLLFGRSQIEIGDRKPCERGLFLDAAGGTLFLDEISALPARTQDLLLRALEDEKIRPSGAIKARAIDVRIVASTCRDLGASVSVGDFSDALLRRLNRVQLEVPALRDRKEDIPLLVDYFFARARAAHDKSLRAVSDEALDSLVNYHWPGNIRELENVIERAVLRAKSDQVSRCDLPESVISPPGENAGGQSAELGLKQARKRLEAKLIRRALRATGGNRTHAARLLQISHRALLYKIKEYRCGE